MILYNTLMGVCAGLALILIPVFSRKLLAGKAIAPEGWALTFGILGIILTFLSGTMAVTWPLNANPPINIAFAEPNLVLGLLLLAAAFFIWQQRAGLLELASTNKTVLTAARARLQGVLVPVSWLVGALGLVLLACTAAIFRFMLVGAAPEAEPITGLLHDHPAIENTFFGLIYGLSAVGALLVPFAVRKPASALPKIVGICWVIAGVCFLLFSAMNYYTHIGMLVNMLQGKSYRF